MNVQITLKGTHANTTAIVDDSTKVADFLDENGVDYESRVTTLNAKTLRGDDIYKTFAELGVTESAKIVSVVKADGAAY